MFSISDQSLLYGLIINLKCSFASHLRPVSSASFTLTHFEHIRLGTNDSHPLPYDKHLIGLLDDCANKYRTVCVFLSGQALHVTISNQLGKCY